MNALLLILPFFLIRFVLLGYLNKDALRRAALFAPLRGNEKTAYLVYQLTTVILVLFPFFLKVETPSPFLIIGIVLYALSLVLLTLSMIDFAKPQSSGINTTGLYRFSRNPMYVGYFLFFLACVVLTQSLVLLAILIVFQLSAHWIILSEERWCLVEFGDEYSEYMKRVRRYI